MKHKKQTIVWTRLNIVYDWDWIMKPTTWNPPPLKIKTNVQITTAPTHSFSFLGTNTKPQKPKKPQKPTEPVSYRPCQHKCNSLPGFGTALSYENMKEAYTQMTITIAEGKVQTPP